MAAVRYITQVDAILRVREMTHTENSYHATDAELGRWLDQGARRLYDILTEGRGQEYYRDEVNVTLAAGTNVYDLPEDFYECLLVYAHESTTTTGGLAPVTVGDGTKYQLRPFELHGLVPLKNTSETGGLSHVSQLRYRLKGQQGTADVADLDQVEIWPTPTVAKIISLIYLPKPTLTSTGEGIGPAYLAPGATAEWLVFYGAEYVAQKRQEDASWYRAQRAELEASIKARATARDASEPVRMRGRHHTAGRVLARGDYAEDGEP